MSERRTKLQPVKVQYVCDHCGDAHLKNTGIVLTCNPPLYRHECPVCHVICDMHHSYPNIIYEEIPE